MVIKKGFLYLVVGGQFSGIDNGVSDYVGRKALVKTSNSFLFDNFFACIDEP